METFVKRERRKNDRPGELLHAALTLFVQKGYAATRVEEVAALAGVSKGTLFLYFPTKFDLFKAVVNDNLALHYPAWNQTFEDFQGSTADMLRLAMHTWWTQIGSQACSGLCKLMVAEGRHFPQLQAFYVESVILPGNLLLRRILERGVSSGEFRSMDCAAAVHTLTAPMVFVMIWQNSMTDYHQQLNFDPDTFVKTQLQVLLHGMCEPQPQPSP